MFRYLALDWGEKYTGIAFGDRETGLIIPYPEPVITSKVWQVLDVEIQRKKTTDIVLGLPTNFEGKPTQISQKVQEFKNILQQTYPSVIIHFINERTTSKDSLAKFSLSKKKPERIDNIAAGRILEHFFSKA